MCLEIAKSGNNVMIPNLVHSRVSRNGKMCAQELPKVAIMFMFPNLVHSRVARNGNGVCPRFLKVSILKDRKKVRNFFADI